MGNRSSTYIANKLEELEEAAKLNTNERNNLLRKFRVFQTDIEETRRGDKRVLDKVSNEMKSTKSRSEKTKSRLDEMEENIRKLDEIDSLREEMMKIASERISSDANLSTNIKSTIDKELQPWADDIARYKAMFEELQNFSTKIATKSLYHDRALRELTKKIDDLHSSVRIKSCKCDRTIVACKSLKSEYDSSNPTASSSERNLNETADENEYIAEERVEYDFEKSKTPYIPPAPPPPDFTSGVPKYIPPASRLQAGSRKK